MFKQNIEEKIMNTLALLSEKSEKHDKKHNTDVIYGEIGCNDEISELLT